MPDWLKLYNTYDPEYYTPGKRVSAEEWNTLFLASVRQGNYNADTLELLIKTYLPETYLTIADFSTFSAQMQDEYATFTEATQNQYSDFTTQIQQDFTELITEVNELEERTIKAEDVAYSLNDTIQEANRYAKQAFDTSEEAKNTAQAATDTANGAVDIADSAVAVSEDAFTNSQTALTNSQSAVNTASTANTNSTQAVNTANAASLRADDAISTANAAKVESASAKTIASQAATTANNANTTSQAANSTATEARQIAQSALDQITEGMGSQVLVNGESVATFNADTKADLDYVDRQIAALIGAAPETLNTLEEVAKAIEENETVVDALNSAIGTKANKADIEPTIQFAEIERQKSKNLFDINKITSAPNYFYVENNTLVALKWLTYTSETLCDLADLVVGKTYTFSFKTTSTRDFIYLRNASEGVAKNIYNGTTVVMTQTLLDSTLGLYCYDSSAAQSATYSEIQIEEGSVVTSYQPYNGLITHNNDATVLFAESERQKSKNLFNINGGSNYKSSNQDRYLINGETLSTDNDYTLLSPSGFKLDTTPNTDYTVSFNVTYQTYCRVYIYGMSNNAHTDIKIVGGLSQGFNSFKFNSGNYDFTVIGFCSALGETATFDSIQVEKGAIATDYQPYRGPILHKEDIKDVEAIRTLPSEYQEVEYIESTGTQYIDTGVVPNQNTGFEIDFKTNNDFNSTSYGCIFGARTQSVVNELQLSTFCDGTNTTGTLRRNTTSNKAGLTSSRMTAKLIGNRYSNSTGYSLEIVSGDFTAPSPITVFTLNQSGSKTQYGKVVLYSFKLYDGLTLVRDFIPCYRKSDGEIGLYDLVNNTFYSNRGTGTFLKGENVYLSNVARRNDAAIKFAESERQKSENIYEYLGDGAINVGYGYVDAIEHKWTPNKDFARTVFMKCKPNTTYHVTKRSSARFVVASFNVTTTDLIPAASKTATVYVTEGDEGQGVTYLKITTRVNDNRLCVFCADTRTDTNIEEILQSIEVTEFGKIVHEKQLKDYLPLSGGTLTGPLRFADNPAIPESDTLDFIVGLEAFGNGGNLKYTNKTKFKTQLLETNGAIIKGRVYGSGDDEGVVVGFADNGYAGVILGSTDARRSCLYLSGGATGTNLPEWRYTDPYGTTSRLYHPHKTGTIACVEDVKALQVGGVNYFISPFKGTSAATGIDASVSGGVLTVNASSGNGNWNSVHIDNYINDNFKEGDPFVFSVDIRATTDNTITVSGKPTVYFNGTLGYMALEGTVPRLASTEKKATLTCRGIWKGSYDYLHFGWSGAQGKFYLDNPRFEKGEVVTDSAKVLSASGDTLIIKGSINLIV